VTYTAAWANGEMYHPKIRTPSDTTLHIPDSSGIRTLCRRHCFGRPIEGNPLGLAVCATCENKRDNPNRKASEAE